MTAKEWLEVIGQAEDYDKYYTPLIIKYGKILIAEHNQQIISLIDEMIEELNNKEQRYIHEPTMIRELVASTIPPQRLILTELKEKLGIK